MKVLIAQRVLASYTGTECYVRDLCAALRAAGDEVAVFTPVAGRVADEIRAGGVRVVDDLERLPFAPDVIHGHHDHPTMAALLRFPRTPAVFFVHDRTSLEDEPPLHPALRRYVAVDANCAERLAKPGIPAERTRMLHNAVDLERFAPRAPLPEGPRRALAFSNSAAEQSFLPALRRACGQAGLALEVVGEGAGRSLARPELALAQADLVFAKARCALEALAVGCAVILCDTRGLGPLVTSAELDFLRRWNFGMRTLTRPHDPALLLAEIRRYDAADAARASRRIRAEAGLPGLTAALRALYAEVIAEGVPAGSEEDAARAAAQFVGALVTRHERLAAEQRAAHRARRARRSSRGIRARVARLLGGPG